MFGTAKLGAVFAMAACLATTPAAAATIGGLFNTGVDDAGVALTGGNGVVDSHWTILASNLPGVAAGDETVTYFNGAYIPENGGSRWISHSADGTGQSPGAGSTTTYGLTFDLTGFNLSTVSLSGIFAADNGATLFLNGVDTGFSTGTFSSFTGFTLTSGFVAGANVLSFVVVDTGPPSALRVADLSGTGDLAGAGAVPEPGVWALMILGFGVAGSALRRRQSALA